MEGAAPFRVHAIAEAQAALRIESVIFIPSKREAIKYPVYVSPAAVVSISPSRSAWMTGPITRSRNTSRVCRSGMVPRG